MRLVPEHVSALPPLAWVADVAPAARQVRVLHGSKVETGNGFLIEGVWDGEFGAGDFASTACVFGSGLTTSADAVTFVSSAATTDYLYHRPTTDGIVVANSLPLLLAYTHDRLDPSFTGYEAINHSIVEGPSGSRTRIPTRNGEVHRLIFRNLRVSAMGTGEVDKPAPPPFPAFEAYRDYLKDRYGAMVANARDRARRHPISILSTQSRGYDTTALNAIAAGFGVDMAFTVTEGKVAGSFVEKENGEAPNDDGTDICAMLGIPCTPIERRSFERDFDDEYLYHASLDRNQDVNLRQVTRHVPGVALLLTGTLGELWYPSSAFPSPPEKGDPLKRGDLGGHGLTEVRLASGIVHLPVPYLGAPRRKDIIAITESPAMDPWRLNTRYDRPIPRRIAEEAGVPREMFGQRKMATVVEFSPPPVPHNPELRARYFRFLVEHGLLEPWQLRLVPLVHRVNGILWFASEQRHRWLHYLQRAVSRVLGRDFRLGLRWRHLDGRLFCFSANMRADEYERMLERPAAAG